VELMDDIPSRGTRGAEKFSMRRMLSGFRGLGTIEHGDD
jgi:hypothetical protein